MGDRVAKDALFSMFAGVAAALGSGRRAEIVDVLAQGERSVEEIAEQIGQTVANTSHHLRTLARGGLVRTRRDGTRIFYALAGERVQELWSAVRAVAEEHTAGLEQVARAYLRDRDGLEAVDRATLAERMRHGEVVVIDVRHPAEYAAGHIDGARSIPLPDLHHRMAELSQGADVVAYCRGRYCVYADEAVRHLVDRGINAARLEDGYPEWHRAGLPIATGAA
jgi:rhodanese-related sulfurtransferase/DNA-binding HxlR family transcriptional regulator